MVRRDVCVYHGSEGRDVEGGAMNKDERRIVGTSITGDPIYELDPDRPPLTEEEQRRMDMLAGIFDCIVVGSDGKKYVSSDEDGLYHPLKRNGYPDLSIKVPLSE
ncbi:MAG TPA: hypothetical protein PKN79_05465 [Sphaerochaeta sp.]|nr:hypothetical protein [Sphaerochaeta sp.]